LDIAGYWRYSRGYVGGFVSGLRENGFYHVPTVTQPAPIVVQPDLDDPEVLLSQAQQEMKETQAKNRERAVQAITQKNNLQAEVNKAKMMVSRLQDKADAARLKDDSELETQLLFEKRSYEQTLVKMENSLVAAQETIERIKTAMRREEERIRAKTAQAMALKTQWKQRQIFADVELTRDADAATILSSMRYEIQAIVTQAHRLSDELWQQAERALRNGNRALAHAILTERAAFQKAFSNPSSETATF
jgi:phage shock protein A